MLIKLRHMSPAVSFVTALAVSGCADSGGSGDPGTMAQGGTSASGSSGSAGGGGVSGTEGHKSSSGGAEGCEQWAGCEDEELACGDTCAAGEECLDGQCIAVIAVVVTTDSELEAAISAGEANRILVAPGIYTLRNMVTGLDRTAFPLSIQAQDPNDKPVFQNATQSIELTRHVTFRNLSFVNTGALGTGDVWIGDGGGTGAGGDAQYITIEGCEFSSRLPEDLSGGTPDPSYPEGMVRLFRFSNYATHTYTLRDNRATGVYQVGDFRMNGEVVIDGLVVDYWYFDGMRIIASGEEGYVEGDRLIAHVDLTNNLAVYEELGNKAPHPDNTQVFNTGSSTNNTNPAVRNLLFFRNRFNPGQYRSNNTQSGLSQSRMINVGYVENLWATKSSPHGISLEGGADGVLIERNTLADVNWASSPWIRIFRSTGQVLVADTFFRGGFNIGTAQNANESAYELDAFNNETSASYDEFFTGPAKQGGVSGLVEMLTPLEATSIGAVSPSGEWRGGVHRAMRAVAPSVTGGDGTATLVEIHVPTLFAPTQEAAGGNDYMRLDARWKPTTQGGWTTVENVESGDVLDGLPAGTIELQTRCVNTAGAGLWSATATVMVQ